MDFPFRHWSAIQRRFPSSVQVANTNFLKNRTCRLQHTFRNFHCSFIFSGKGYLKINGQTHPVSAPCAFTIYSGESIDYAPDSADEAWNQLYYDFEPRFVPELERQRLVDPSQRIWPMADSGNVWALAEELCALSNTFPLEKAVDFVDRLCERILIASQMALEEEPPEDRAIRRVLNKMRREPNQPFDLAETVRLSHMSEATFRRRWESEVGMTPRRYLEHLRIQMACRLLIETDLSVNEVAGKVGFEDEFYFSRRFRAMTQLSPRAYRNQHQIG